MVDKTGKVVQPDSTTMTAADYKHHLEVNALVHNAVAGAFNVRAADTPDMSVVIESGNIWTGAAIIEQTSQTLGSIPAPSVNPRVDIIEIDPLTGTAYRVQGAGAASPVKPAVTAGRVPLAYYQIAVGATAITNAMIVPVRSPSWGGVMRSGDQSISGNLAIGGALRAWSGAKHLDIGNVTSVTEAGNESGIYNNLIHDGTNFRHIINGYGTILDINPSSGDIQVSTAPSGVAGAIASPAEKFKIATDGTTTINGNVVRHNGNIFHGRVDSNGTAIRLPNGWTSVRNGVGNYTVTHNIGSFNYTITMSRSYTGLVGHNRGINSFSVYTSNSGGTAVDWDFDFIVMVD